MTDRELKIFQRAAQLQNKCNAHVEDVVKENPEITYQEAINAWIFLKLAELEICQPNYHFK